MNIQNKNKFIIFLSIGISAIVLLTIINFKYNQTPSNGYAEYFLMVDKNAVNLTRNFQDEIALWNLGDYSNSTMAKITENYLPKFSLQLKEFNNTPPPQTYLKAKQLLVSSLNSEIKSYELFKDYLLTNNSTKNNISTNYLSDSLRYEALAFKEFRNAHTK